MASSANTGKVYAVDTAGADIVGFDPAHDKLDLGGVSVHNFIVVDTPTGVGFMNPWTGDTIIVKGVSLGQLTVDSFAPVENAHLRECLSGALAWEQGVTPSAHTVYARSHELGQIDKVAFDPATDVVDFRYYGSREQITMTDGAEGVVISNTGTGQSLILLGVTKAELTLENFRFYYSEVREDRLHLQLGFGPVSDRQIVPQNVPVAGTAQWPSGVGAGNPSSGVEGETFKISWQYGVNTVLHFDPASDKLDFGWFKAAEFSLTEVDGSTVISIVNNKQTYTLTGVSLAELTMTNITALSVDARAEWQGVLDSAAASTPQLSVAGATLTEGDTGQKTMSLLVSLSAATDHDVSVSYTTMNGLAVAGADYQAQVGTVTIAAGQTQAVIKIPVINDKLVELTETFTVMLSSPKGATLGTSTATATILDNDVDPNPGEAPKIRIMDIAMSEGDDGMGHLHLMVTLSKASSETITVQYTTADGSAHAGSDYAATSGTITFAPGQTSQEIMTHISGDTVIEGNETFQVKLSGAKNAMIADRIGVATIVNDDLPSLSISDATVTEGNTGYKLIQFTVSLSEAMAKSVRVDYATQDAKAHAGVDYVAKTGSLIFAAGETTKTISVRVLGDKVAEALEQFNVVLSNARNAKLSDAVGQGQIIDNDTALPKAPQISISDAQVTEGTSGPGWLSTSGNQIVDAMGHSVQISGVNWFGFEGTNMNPNGLWTRSYQDMMKQMVQEGFNTIRLPFSSDMLHSTATPGGIDYNKNPDLKGLTALQIMDKIVAYAEQIGIKIILDHHRSSAGNGTSENGLWYDSTHTQAAWVADWQMLAERYADNTAVIGADLHNEPYNGTWGGGGAKDWALAAETAGNAIGQVNPNWLIFVEGVASYKGQNYWWGGNLMGVRDRPIDLTLDNKLVYSAHDYPQSVYDQKWFSSPDYPNNLSAVFDQAWGYIFREGIAPVYLGEFGTKLTAAKDIQWLDAITAYLGGDFDNNGTVDLAAGTKGISWTYWSWNPNSGDTGGILKDDWTTVNNNKMVYLTPIEDDLIETGATGGDPAHYASFTVTLTEAATSDVSVDWHTVEGTAAIADFTTQSGQLLFHAGETTKTIKVAITGDALQEPNERFAVVLSNPVGVTVADGTGQGTILDDDAVTAIAARVADTSASDPSWVQTMASSDAYDFVAQVEVQGHAGALSEWHVPVSASAASEGIFEQADGSSIAHLFELQDSFLGIARMAVLDPAQLDQLF